MAKKLELWTLNSDSVDDQLLFIAREPQHREQQQQFDFDGFNNEEDIASTPRRQVQAVLNRTILDPIIDSLVDSEIRVMESNVAGELLGSSEGPRPGSSATDAISVTTRDSRHFYYLTASELLDADLATHTVAQGAGYLEVTCGSDLSAGSRFLRQLPGRHHASLLVTWEAL
jgi:hypothetical protein